MQIARFHVGDQVTVRVYPSHIPPELRGRQCTITAVRGLLKRIGMFDEGSQPSPPPEQIYLLERNGFVREWMVHESWLVPAAT